MKAIAIQKEKMIIPTSKIIIDAFLEPHAVVVWVSGLFMALINTITITPSMDWVANGSAIILACGGIYGLFGMREKWLEARAKRKLAEHILEESEEHSEAENVIKMKNQK